MMADYQDGPRPSCPSFDGVLGLWPWRPIPNCPGRYKLPTSTSPPHAVAGIDTEAERYRVPAARDPVLVVRFAAGGLISYEQPDGSFVHTLGDAEGFARKLIDLGL